MENTVPDASGMNELRLLIIQKDNLVVKRESK